MKKDKKIYFADDVCQFLQIPRATLLKWYQRKKIPEASRNKFNNYRVYNLKDVEKIAKIVNKPIKRREIMIKNLKNTLKMLEADTPLSREKFIKIHSSNGKFVSHANLKGKSEKVLNEKYQAYYQADVANNRTLISEVKAELFQLENK